MSVTLRLSPTSMSSSGSLVCPDLMKLEGNGIPLSICFGCFFSIIIIYPNRNKSQVLLPIRLAPARRHPPFWKAIDDYGCPLSVRCSLPTGGTPLAGWHPEGGHPARRHPPFDKDDMGIIDGFYLLK